MRTFIHPSIHSFILLFIHSFIRSEDFYSAPSRIYSGAFPAQPRLKKQELSENLEGYKELNRMGHCQRKQLKWATEKLTAIS